MRNQRRKKNHPDSLKPAEYFGILTLLLLSLFPMVLPPTTLGHAVRMTPYGDPLGSFQGTGSVPVFWSGNQKINNTSFENGVFQPWTTSSFNANASRDQVISPGLNDYHAVQLSVTSGNLTSGSYDRLTQDLSSAQALFSNNTLLQASVQVTTLTGNSSMDRAGVILSLVSSTGTTIRLHYVFASGAGLPANTTSDGYFKVAGFGSSGWISINRNLASDTQSVFPNLTASIDAVKDVSLYVDSMSYGTPNRDPRIKFFDHYGSGAWNSSESVVFDSDLDGTYQPGDQLLYNGTYAPSTGNSLINDPLIKYVDANNNGRWDTAEPIVYDCYYSSNPNNVIPGDCNNNIVDLNEFWIYGSPIIGQLLMDPIRRTTTASFDQVQIFSPTSNGNLIVNGGFETGTLASWGNQAGFSASNLAHSGSHSALGSVTGGTSQLAQSIDSQPRVNSLTNFQAFVNIASLTGTTANDRVDVWLGLSDSKGTPLSLYYVFDTGNGVIPANATGAIYYKASGFGTLGQWLSISRSLFQDTAQFNSQGFSAPYSLNLVVLELTSQGSGATSAYFDDLFLSPGLVQPGYAPSGYFGLDGQNTTYTYTVSNVQSGAFLLQVPAGQSVLNVTTPISTILQPSDYSVANTPPTSLISIPNSTGTRYPIGGTYHFYTTSTNAVALISATDATSQAILNLTIALSPGKRVNLIELSLDPFATPILGANSTISLWSSNGTRLNSWTGTSDSTGFFRVNNIALPTSSGTYTLQATSYSSANIGIRTRQLSIQASSQPGTFSPILIAIIIIAIIGGVTGFLIFYQRRKRMINASNKQQAPLDKGKNNKTPPARA